MKKLIFILAVAFSFAFQGTRDQESSRWARPAQNVTIVRDDWGIAHVYGKTQAVALLLKTETGIAATSNVTLNEVLPSGFKLAGTVSGKQSRRAEARVTAIRER